RFFFREPPLQRLELGEPRAATLVAGLALKQLAIDLDGLVGEALVEIQLGQRRRRQLVGLRSRSDVHPRRRGRGRSEDRWRARTAPAARSGPVLRTAAPARSPLRPRRAEWAVRLPHRSPPDGPAGRAARAVPVAAPASRTSTPSTREKARAGAGKRWCGPRP